MINFRRRLLVVLLALAVEPIVAQAQTTKPIVTVAIAPLNQTREKARALAEAIAPGEGAAFVEAKLKNALGIYMEKLGAFDSDQPVGLYGTLGDASAPPMVVTLVPVKSESVVEEILVERSKVSGPRGGIRQFSIATKPPTYFRVLDGYMYSSKYRAALETEALVNPQDFLFETQSADVVVMLMAGKIPADAKQRELEELKSRLQSRAGNAAGPQAMQLQQIADMVSTLVNETEVFGLRVKLDRATWMVDSDIRLAAKNGTNTAHSIARLKETANRFAGLISERSILSVLNSHTMDERSLRQFAPSIRTEIERLFGKGQVDSVLDIRTSADGTAATAVFALSIKDTKLLDALVRGIPTMSPVAAELVTVDAKSIGAAKVHEVRFPPLPNVPPLPVVQGFLNNPVYVTFQNNAAYAVAGTQGFETLQAVVKTADATRIGPAIQLNAALGRLARLVPIGAVTGLGNCNVKLTMDGGKRLKAAFTVNAKELCVLLQALGAF